MNIIEMLQEFKTNPHSIDVQALKTQITLRSIQQLNLSEYASILSQIVATLYDEGDTQELVSMSIYMAKNSIPLISNLTLNTLTVLLFNSSLIDLSKKIAKFNLKHYIIDKPQLYLISHLNLVKIQYFQSNYLKCFRLVERALIKYEPYIFKEMKNNTNALQKNPQDLILLLNGYLFYAKCVQQLQKQQEMLDTDYNKFYYNGHKICKKYLPSTHYLNSYFNFQRSASISRKSLSIKQKIITLKVSTSKRISAQCNTYLKSIKHQKPKQKQLEIAPFSQPEVIRIEMFDSGAKSSDRMTQPKQFRLHSPKQPPLDIQNIIQHKFDNFVQTFSTKKSLPKITSLEKRIQELQRENLRILQYRMEKEQEISNLKSKIDELNNELTEFKKNQQEQQQNSMQEIGNFLPQNFEQQQKSLFLPTPKINRQSTTEIRTLIQTLNQGQQLEETKVLKIPDINLSNSYNDEHEIIIIDQLDQGKEYSIQLQNDITIIKKLMIDNVLIDVSCMMQGNQLKFTFLENKVEMIDMNALHNFLQVAEFKISLPFNCPLKCICTFAKFIEHCIFPFISIQDFQVKLQHLPVGLFQEAEKILFFEEECQINLIPIDYDCFRLIIINQQQQGWFDIQFDQSSFELFFDQFNQEEFEKEAVQFILDHLNQKEQSLSQINKKQVFSIASFAMKNQKQFLIFFESLKQNIENELSSLLEIEDLTGFLNILNGEQISLQHNNAVNPKLCILRVSEKATKTRFVMIADNSTDNCFEILLQNFYETHGIKLMCMLAPRNQKVKANGYDQLEYGEINKIFGLAIPLLDYADIQLISFFLSQMFELYTFNKELDIEDYDRYKENCLIQTNLQSECCNKFFVAAEYRIPINICYVGINDKPIGVLVKVFDELGMIENGMIFTISQGVWDKPRKEPIVQKKRKPPKYIACNKMTSDYHIVQILQSVGWQVVFDNVSINQENLQACRIINENKTSFVDRLENIFNIYIKN